MSNVSLVKSKPENKRIPLSETLEKLMRYSQEFPGVVALSVLGTHIMNGLNETEAYEALTEPQRAAIHSFMRRS